MSVERKVVISDPGIDDAAAANYLNKRGESYTLMSSFGNVSGEQAYANVQRLVRHLELKNWRVAKGPNGPLDKNYKRYSDMAKYGGNGPDGLWEIPDPENTTTPVTVEKIDASQVDEIVSLAPLTGSVRLIKNGAQPEQMLVMGGAFKEGNVRPIISGGEYADDAPRVAEWNIYKDPEAARQFFSIYANDKVCVVPKDACMHTLISAQLIIDSEEKPTIEHKFLRKLLRGWAMEYGKINPPVVERGLMLADLVAVILFKNRNLATWEKKGIEVATEIGPELGRTFLSETFPSCNIAVTVTNQDDLFETLCQSVFGESK